MLAKTFKTTVRTGSKEMSLLLTKERGILEKFRNKQSRKRHGNTKFLTITLEEIVSLLGIGEYIDLNDTNRSYTYLTSQVITLLKWQERSYAKCLAPAMTQISVGFHKEISENQIDGVIKRYLATIGENFSNQTNGKKLHYFCTKEYSRFKETHFHIAVIIENSFTPLIKDGNTGGILLDSKNTRNNLRPMVNKHNPQYVGSSQSQIEFLQLWDEDSFWKGFQWALYTTKKVSKEMYSKQRAKCNR